AGLAVQLHFEPRYAPGFEPLIKEFADTRVIIDHLGRPFQGTPEEYDTVVAWSKHKNTVMKVSSVPPTKQYPHRDVAPVIRRLTGAFGGDGLTCGGGWGAGATPESHGAGREGAAGFLTHLSGADRARVFGGTAAKLFRFGA